MGNLTYPGVYIEELPSGVHTIAGVATSIAAFVGWAPKGPTDHAVLVQSFMDFQRQFGGLDSRSLLGYSVSQFFNNGGQQAYIVRLVQSPITTGTATGTVPGAVTLPVTGGSTVSFTAKISGRWSSAYGIQISNPNPPQAGHFIAAVVYAPQGTPLVTLETLSLSINPFAAPQSKYMNIAATGTPTAVPAPGLYMLAGGADGNGVNVPGAVAAAIHFGSVTVGFTFTAKNEGAWGNLLAIAATPKTGDATRFSINIAVLNPSGALSVAETYNNLSALSTDPFYVVTVINNDSNYVTVSAQGTPSAAVITTFPTTNVSIPFDVTQFPFLTGGYDGVVLDPTQDSGGGLFETALNAGTGTGGVHLLDTVDIFNLLCVPGESDGTTISSLQKYCNAKRAFYIVDPPQSKSPSDFVTAQGPVVNGSGSITGQYAINSAYYYPWVQAPDPLIGSRLRYFPPCGFVAGIYAATDATRGVWKAPAGIDASFTGVAGLQYVMTDTDNGNLNQVGVNCLRQFNVYGDVVWGSRTLRGSNQAASEWKYVPIRRLALFIESSLYDGTQWVVFEPNDAPLWSQIRLNVGSFMQGLFLQGAFQGTTPQQAYFVKCDSDNNPQSSIDLGVVNILVGFAPLYPAEFVVIQIQQMAGQLQS
jgi:phage tail sheath protein FI